MTLTGSVTQPTTVNAKAQTVIVHKKITVQKRLQI